MLSLSLRPLYFSNKHGNMLNTLTLRHTRVDAFKPLWTDTNGLNNINNRKAHKKATMKGRERKVMFIRSMEVCLLWCWEVVARQTSLHYIMVGKIFNCICVCVCVRLSVFCLYCVCAVYYWFDASHLFTIYKQWMLFVIVCQIQSIFTR